MNQQMNAPFLNGQTLGDLSRSLRLAVVQNQYDCGNLTLDEATELLKANLTPNDDSTFFDDSQWLKVKQ